MPRIETYVTVCVSVPRQIDKHDLKFHYTFRSKRDELELCMFEVTGLEPLKYWDNNGRQTRYYICLGPGYIRNEFNERGYGEKNKFNIRSLRKYRTLKNVRVPVDVRDRACAKMTRLITRDLKLRNG